MASTTGEGEEGVGQSVPSGGGRKKGIQLSLPFVYGNHACQLPASHPLRISKEHTHQWTVYVRSPYGQVGSFIQNIKNAAHHGHGKDGGKVNEINHVDDQVGYFIRKVVFRLHESFENRVRVIERPPFQVTETGWGEFEIQIQVHLHDYSERSVKVVHLLKLFPPEEEDVTTLATVGTDENGPTIIVEHFDEVVISEPTERFYDSALQHMHRQQQLQKISSRTAIDISWTPAQEMQEIQQYEHANAIIVREMQQYREMIAQRAQEVQDLKGEILSLDAR